METTNAFPVALRELVVENDYVTETGRPNWTAFASELDGFHYETLRRVTTGVRAASPELMEECARALRIRPEYFFEYRLYLAQQDFNPAVVGRERAVENLTLWRSATKSRRHRGLSGR